MKNNYLLKIGENQIAVQTNDDGEFSMYIDGEDIYLEVNEKGLRVEINKVFQNPLPAIEVSEAVEAKMKESSESDTKQLMINGVARTCCYVGNRYYCINKGCAFTPCGKICG